MEKPCLNIGIIGCGGIANGKHMPALSKIREVRMTAFCDIIEERAQRAREKYGTPDSLVTTDYRKVLEDPSIDVVHVLTPNRWHSDITVDALEAGKHVMCEKPMAINSIEAKRMLDAAARTGKKLTIGYQSRQRPDARYLKQEVEAGTLGDIYYAKATAVRRRAVPTWGVFLDEYAQGGGPLIDIGTHALDLTLWTMDNYRPKYCVGTNYHALNKQTNQGNDWGNWDPDKFTVEDSAFGFIVMENGATITLEASWALNVLDAREAITQLCGTLGGADMLDGLRFNGIKNNQKYMFIPQLEGKGAAFYSASKQPSAADLEARQWIDAILCDRDPCVLPAQAYTVTRILEGLYVSAKTGDIFRF